MDNGEVMNRRGSLSGYPFVTLKAWAEVHHFPMRGLARCRGEFNLMTCYCNCRRAFKGVGVGALVACCRLWKEVRGIGM